MHRHLCLEFYAWRPRVCTSRFRPRENGGFARLCWQGVSGLTQPQRRQDRRLPRPSAGRAATPTAVDRELQPRLAATGAVRGRPGDLARGAVAPGSRGVRPGADGRGILAAVGGAHGGRGAWVLQAPADLAGHRVESVRGSAPTPGVAELSRGTSRSRRSMRCSARRISPRRGACAIAPCSTCCTPPACACRNWSRFDRPT